MRAPSEEIYDESTQGANCWKQYLQRYNSVAIFIHLAIAASQICEIPRNSPKIRTYIQGHRSWCQSRAHIYMQCLSSNFGRISYRLRDIDAFSSKIARFLHRTPAWRPLAEERSAISTYSYNSNFGRISVTVFEILTSKARNPSLCLKPPLGRSP